MSLAAPSLSNCLLPGYSCKRVCGGRVGAQLGRISGAAAWVGRVLGGRPGSIFAGDSEADRGAAGSGGSVAHTTQFQALSATGLGSVATAASQQGAGMAENRASRNSRRLIDNLQTRPLSRHGSPRWARPRERAGRGGATPSHRARRSDIPSRTPCLKSGKIAPSPRPYPVGTDGTAAAICVEVPGQRAEISSANPGSGVRVPRSKALPAQKRAKLAESGCVLALGTRVHISLDLCRNAYQAKAGR